jgi:hypothetical protein
MVVSQHLPVLAQQNPDPSSTRVQHTPPERDGQHDFDFEIGAWKTHLRRLLHPLTGSTTWLEKSLRLCLAGLRIRRFDPIAKASELSDHSRGALLLGLFGDRRAPLFVTNSLVQDQPDQSTLSMGNGPDGLVMS